MKMNFVKRLSYFHTIYPHYYTKVINLCKPLQTKSFLSNQNYNENSVKPIRSGVECRPFTNQCINCVYHRG